MLLLLALACFSSSPSVESPPPRLVEALGMEALTRSTELAVLEGEVAPLAGYSVRPVSLQVFPDFRVSAALWLPDGPGPHPGVLMAHGHFGEGKSSGEAQGPAHHFAAAGYAVLAVDTPGVEEGDRPGRQIHFQGGAQNRALLASAGSSAMAVQLHGLQAGLDYLESRRDIGAVAVTGASGGAVQALYLLLVDPRPRGAVLASFVPMPREARASGCACDGLPGWPGPDPGLLSAIDRPTLWLSELEQVRPDGLPRGADYQVLAGPHGYERPMIDAALEWLGDTLGGGGRSDLASTPYSSPQQLRSSTVGDADIADLLSLEAALPLLSDAPPLPYSLSCRGRGPTVLTLGVEEEDRVALGALEARVCAVDIAVSEVDQEEALIRQRPLADALAATVVQVQQREGALALYAVGAWGLPAMRSGLPYVLRDPLLTPAQVSPEDPAWVHMTGAWGQGVYEGALGMGDRPGPLVEVLVGAVQAGARR